MNNAAASIINTVGRAPAPPKRQQSSRSGSSTDFLQTVKQAVVSKNQKEEPAAEPDQNQGSQDDGKTADKLHDSSKDSSKDTSKDVDKDGVKDASKADAGQNAGAASLEAPVAETAGLLSNRMQDQISQAQTQTSQTQHGASGVQARIPVQDQTLSALTSVAAKPSAALESGQIKLTGAQTPGEPQTLSQSALEAAAKGLKTAEGKETTSNSPTVSSPKTETAAAAKASAQQTSVDGKAQLFGQAAGEKPVSVRSAAEALQTGQAAGGQLEDGKASAQPEDSVHKAEKTSSDQIGQSRADVSTQSAGAPQEAKAPDLVKIKVGEGPLNPQSQQFPQDVAKTVLRYSQNGTSEFDIQLTPKELGTIHIQLIFDKGTASVLMNCADPKTQNLLSLNTEQIRSIVQDETGLHTTVQLKEDPSSQNGRQDFDGRGENPQRDAQRQEQQQQRRNQLDQELFSQQFRMEFQRTAAVGSAV